LVWFQPSVIFPLFPI